MDWDRFGTMFFQGIVVFAVLFLGYVLAKSVDASGKVDYCYIEVRRAQDNHGTFIGERPTLNGHIEWRSDKYIGMYETVDQAKEAANKLGCEIR